MKHSIRCPYCGKCELTYAGRTKDDWKWSIKYKEGLDDKSIKGMNKHIKTIKSEYMG